MQQASKLPPLQGHRGWGFTHNSWWRAASRVMSSEGAAQAVGFRRTVPQRRPGRALAPSANTLHSSSCTGPAGGLAPKQAPGKSDSRKSQQPCRKEIALPKHVVVFCWARCRGPGTGSSERTRHACQTIQRGDSSSAVRWRRVGNRHGEAEASWVVGSLNAIACLFPSLLKRLTQIS